jgi:4,5-dihydroxyphthalate decarboxylase
VKIKFACSLYDRMLPLYTGEVKPEGLDFEFVHINWSREIFDRMAGKQEFEAGEFSSSEFVARESAKQNPFVALPVFPSRMFRHGFVWINARSGIRSPKDLAGKRIGVPVYTMTAAIWIRGHLMHDYGVDFSGVRWVQGSINSPGSHGDPHVLPPLQPVNVVANETGRSLSDLLSDGEIDAIIGTQLPCPTRESAIPTCAGSSPITRRSSRTTTGAPASFPSCISWRSGATRTSAILRWRRACMTPSKPPSSSRSSA